jgi:uncharacterized protein
MKPTGTAGQGSAGQVPRSAQSPGSGGLRRWLSCQYPAICCKSRFAAHPDPGATHLRGLVQRFPELFSLCKSHARATAFHQKDDMTPFLYTASVPVFTQMLGGLAAVLHKAEAHATAKKIEPDALLLARLFPDMFSLKRQVQVASDFAKSVSARLADVEPLKFDDTEETFGELQARIVKANAFIDSLPLASFVGAESREIVTQAGTPREKRFNGESYLLTYGLPHFFFHTTTAYAILRQNGVELGKKDYIGA